MLAVRLDSTNHADNIKKFILSLMSALIYRILKNLIVELRKSIYDFICLLVRNENNSISMKYVSLISLTCHRRLVRFILELFFNIIHT